ncbi:hypothetical protein [Nocardia sp. NPDC052566]|uniref:hypothetical protein n=1 Tax=Nocardia sp. NPDC052566 TaxID=3364330 RepID=UPI0037C7F6D7
MDTRSLLRLGSAAGLLCGTAIALAGLTELVLDHKNPVTQLLNGGAVPFGIGLLVAIYLPHHGRLGRFGMIAFTVQFLGFGYFAGVAFARNFVLVYLDRPVVNELLTSPAKLAFLFTAITALTGTILFGTALLRTGVVPRPAATLYTVGLSLLCLTFLLPAPLVRAGHIAAGAGMLWLAITVWTSTSRSATIAHAVPAH